MEKNFVPKELIYNILIDFYNRFLKSNDSDMYAKLFYFTITIDLLKKISKNCNEKNILDAITFYMNIRNFIVHVSYPNYINENFISKLNSLNDTKIKDCYINFIFTGISPKLLNENKSINYLLSNDLTLRNIVNIFRLKMVPPINSSFGNVDSLMKDNLRIIYSLGKEIVNEISPKFIRGIYNEQTSSILMKMLIIGEASYKILNKTIGELFYRYFTENDINKKNELFNILNNKQKPWELCEMDSRLFIYLFHIRNSIGHVGYYTRIYNQDPYLEYLYNYENNIRQTESLENIIIMKPFINFEKTYEYFTNPSGFKSLLKQIKKCI